MSRDRPDSAVVDEVVDVEARLRTVPLAAPVSVGTTPISEREYVLVTVHSASGATGHSYALTRSVPLPEMITSLGRGLVIGRDGDRVVELHDRLVRSTVAAGRAGALMKAIGLLDTALWDLKARRLGVPLWRLLGGGSATNTALLVAAYPDPNRDVAELAEQVLEYARAGWRLVKIARDPDPDRMHRWLALLARALPRGVSLVVDCAWAYRTAGEALADLRRWPELPLAWVEDPFAPENSEAFVRLRARCDLPIGAGDEVADLHVLETLMRQRTVDVVRLDTSCLGVVGSREAATLACAWGVPVSYHVYPEISAHLAASRPEGGIVESFDPQGNPYDPSRSILRGGAVAEGGQITATEEPGLGFSFSSDT
jgi:L-alanine-DL-glutamate epimerase-like enolase superfamily enzyme